MSAPAVVAAPTMPVTVTSLADSGPGSLRQAIQDAAPGETITFSVSGIIYLSSELVIDKDLTIDGGSSIVLNGNDATRVLNLTAGHLQLENIDVANGDVQTTDCGSGNIQCGGGLILQDASTSAMVINTTFIRNRADQGSGAIQNFGTLTVINSLFLFNSSGTSGGGLGNTGEMTIIDSRITNNDADGAGGGIRNNNSSLLIIRRSTLNDNYAANSGGGILNTGTLEMYSSTVSGNSTFNGFFDVGGGVYNNGGTMTLADSTIILNAAAVGGGVTNNNGSTTLARTIVTGNTTALSTGTQVYQSAGTITGGNYNVIGADGSADSTNFTPSGTDVIPAGTAGSVLNTTLSNNGGPTLTHALVSGSPAVDLIPTTDPSCDPGTTLDQRGAARGNGVNAGGPACDAGAFEFDSALTPTAVQVFSFAAGPAEATAVWSIVVVLTLVTVGILVRRTT